MGVIGGKAWRPILMCLVTDALGGNRDLVMPLSVLCEMAHNGTLMVDDVEDDSRMRRGKPCIHITYGVDIAINAGNGLPFLGPSSPLSPLLFPLVDLQGLPRDWSIERRTTRQVLRVVQPRAP